VLGLIFQGIFHMPHHLHYCIVRIAKNIKCLDARFQEIDPSSIKVPTLEKDQMETMEGPALDDSPASEKCILMKNLLETFAYELEKYEDLIAINKARIILMMAEVDNQLK
jgi:hypothetical protein